MRPKRLSAFVEKRRRTLARRADAKRQRVCGRRKIANIESRKLSMSRESCISSNRTGRGIARSEPFGKRANSGEQGASAPGKAKEKEQEKKQEPRALTTDADARVMKMADGGFRPAYNVQFASDTQGGAVAGVTVDNSGSDMGKMASMNEALARDYGERPRQHLADGGDVKFDDIVALEKAGVEVYAPVPAPRDKSRDRYLPQQDDAPAIAAWRKRMNEEAAKDIYKQRAATAECTNAQARNRGLRQFLVRGVDKVKSIALMHGLTHNMVCGWRSIAI